MSDIWWWLLVMQIVNGFAAEYVGKQFIRQPDWNVPGIFRSPLARALLVVGPQVIFIGIVVGGFILTDAPWILLGASIVIFAVAFSPGAEQVKRPVSEAIQLEGRTTFNGTARGVQKISEESCESQPEAVHTYNESQSPLKFFERGALILTWMFLILMFLFDFRSFFIAAFTVSVIAWAILFYLNLFGGDV